MLDKIIKRRIEEGTTVFFRVNDLSLSGTQDKPGNTNKKEVQENYVKIIFNGLRDVI